MFGLMLVLVWAVPMVGAGAVLAHRSLPEAPPPEAPPPKQATLAWEDLDRLDEFAAHPPQLHTPRKPSAPVPQAPVVEAPANGPLTIRLQDGLFATTFTTRCEDGSNGRAAFTNGVAVVAQVPDSLCTISFQGGGFTQRLVHRGPGEITCRDRGGTVTCR